MGLFGRIFALATLLENIGVFGVFSTCFSLPATEVGQAVQVEPQTIVPGRFVGNLRLGMTKAELERSPMFSWQTKPDEVYSYQEPCKYTEMHWIDIENDSNGVFAYLRDGVVCEVTAASKRFKVQGMKYSYGATLEEISSATPTGELFRWTDSNSKVNGE